MEPSELAEEVEATIRACVKRVGPESIGAQQYHKKGEPQLFETITVEKLLEMWEEEAEDIINYGVMLRIRINRMKAEIVRMEEALRESRNHIARSVAAADQRVGLSPGSGPVVSEHQVS